MLLYFSVIGGLFYKIFLKSSETMNTSMTVTPPPFSNKKAAGIHVR